MSLSRFLNLLFLVFLGLVQLSGSAFIAGVKPDLVFTYVVFLGLSEKKWPLRLAFLLAGILLVNFSPVFSLIGLLFAVAAVIGFLIIDYWQWQPVFSFLLAVIFGTLIINLSLIEPAWIVVAKEVAYNETFGLILLGVRISERARLNSYGQKHQEKSPARRSYRR